MALDPEELTPEASLNRVVIAGLPGCPLDEGIVSKTGYELLGSPSWVSAIRERAGALGLTEAQTADDVALPPLLAQLLESPEPDIREAATAIVRQFGRRLGALIAVLKRGDPVNRDARPSWDDTYWDHWGQIRDVWLGGGLLTSRRLGWELKQAADGFLIVAGVRDCSLHLYEHPTVLPLIGAARCVEDGSEAAFVADFGHSFVKRGIARYELGSFEALDVLPSLPAQTEADLLAERMATVLSDGWREQSRRYPELSPAINISIASYVKNNHPIDYRPWGYSGQYALLHDMTDSLGEWLSDRVSAQVGSRISVVLMHDGTAAAQAIAGAPNAAVITLGTALGSGFPWISQPVLPLASQFEVTDSW